jgi:hypothetical protein
MLGFQDQGGSVLIEDIETRTSVYHVNVGTLSRLDCTCIDFVDQDSKILLATVRGARSETNTRALQYGKVSRGGIHVEVVMTIQMLKLARIRAVNNQQTYIRARGPWRQHERSLTPGLEGAS